MGVVGLGGQGRCEQRREDFVKIKNKIYIYIYIFFFFFGGVGLGWGVRMDVNEELKFF